MLRFVISRKSISAHYKVDFDSDWQLVTRSLFAIWRGFVSSSFHKLPSQARSLQSAVIGSHHPSSSCSEAARSRRSARHMSEHVMHPKLGPLQLRPCKHQVTPQDPPSQEYALRYSLAPASRPWRVTQFA